MARPVTIRDEDILAAAREVFLARGIQATTAEVAARAGVSEGIVFKRFKTKALLFRAALSMGTEPILQPPAMPTAADDVDARAILFDVGMVFAAKFRTIVPIAIMALSGGETVFPEELRGPTPMPIRAIQGVTAFFEGLMRRGVLRPSDPEILARTFIGAIWHFVFLDVMLGRDVALPMAEEVFVRGHVDLIWKGIAPATAEVAKASKPKKAGRKGASG